IADGAKDCFIEDALKSVRPEKFDRQLGSSTLLWRLKRRILYRHCGLPFAAIRHFLDRGAAIASEQPILARAVMLVLKIDHEHAVADQLKFALQPLQLRVVAVHALRRVVLDFDVYRSALAFPL